MLSLVLPIVPATVTYPYQIPDKARYEAEYSRSLQDPAGFWASVASHFVWRRRWNEALSGSFGSDDVRWFDGATLNITENALDRHLSRSGDKPALLWEPNDPAEPGRAYTYSELHGAVTRFAAVLHGKGIRKGDRVCLYMGQTPELAIAMLACARVGAIHSVVFGGFSAQSLRDRIQDAGAKCVITADGAFRGAKTIPLKPIVDEALADCPTVSFVVVHERTGAGCDMQDGRDSWWDDALAVADSSSAAMTPAAIMAAEDPMFILYTSGSTGRPKGVVHACGGYMLYATYSFVNVFQYRPGEVFFCTADLGWITGHSYGLYAPLCAGGTTLLFEGVPTFPDAGRFWDIVAKYRVNILYTAPTAIRSLMAFGTEPLHGKDLSSLRVLGSVGEPINEEAWHWYHEHVGGGRCPVVDTWWQTETGGIMISGLAGITQSKPAHAGLPLPGVVPVLVTEQGEELAGNDVSGILLLKAPWPSAIRTTWGDDERCRQTYFSAYPGHYFTGDGALRDRDGEYRITGRVDDVLNVSGHRIGTAEVENAINEHPAVIESAVVGFPHPVKGQGIYAFVIADPQADLAGLDAGIAATISRIIGAIAKPDKVQIVSGLPKTRSGKIMRRILRKIAEGELDSLGDTSTLLDPGVVEEIIRGQS